CAAFLYPSTLPLHTPSFFFFLSTRRPPSSTLFPYTTLFRSYPSRPIRVVVPYAAGGTGDLLGRLAAQQLSAAFNQQAIVDNRPRSEEHTSELQSLTNLVCRLLLEKKKNSKVRTQTTCIHTHT